MLALSLCTSSRKEQLIALRYRNSYSGTKAQIIERYGAEIETVIHKYDKFTDEELWGNINWYNERISQIIDKISIKDLEDAKTLPTDFLDAACISEVWPPSPPQVSFSWFEKIFLTAAAVCISIIIIQFI